MFTVNIQIGLASLLHGGVLKRFSNLKIVLLESGCSWIPIG